MSVSINRHSFTSAKSFAVNVFYIREMLGVKTAETRSNNSEAIQTPKIFEKLLIPFINFFKPSKDIKLDSKGNKVFSKSTPLPVPDIDSLTIPAPSKTSQSKKTDLRSLPKYSRENLTYKDCQEFLPCLANAKDIKRLKNLMEKIR